jgi:hypothetical protein
MRQRINPGSAPGASWVLLIAALAPLASAYAAGEGRTTVHIPHVSRPPRIEDFLNDSAERPGLKLAEFVQREPNDGAPASQQTTAFLSYDENNLYAVFVCKDEPGKVRAHMSRRESISDDDVVGLLLDTYHDGRRAYMFYANPLGIQLDGISTEGQPDDYTFDTVWNSEGRLLPDGYIVRFSIPFKSVRFPRTQGGTWGVALLRAIRRNQEYSMWPHVTDRVEAFVPQFGAADGLDRVKPGRNIQITPYGFLEGERFLNGGAMERKRDLRAGADVKAVLHDSLTLDLTINPDFSQVESDEPQVTVNQRYEVFFPEKRPFFLDNAGYFQTPETLFFSRRILNPQFGARLTGKIGQWAVGLLATDDRRPDQSQGESDDAANGRTRIGVARIQRDIGRESNVGFLLTSYRSGLISNEVFSADMRYKLNSNWVVTGQAALSRTTGEATSVAAGLGTAYFAEIRHTGRHLAYYTAYRDRSPEFHTEVGYIPRVDIRQALNYMGYTWRPEEGKLVSFGPAVSATVNWDHTGRLQDWSVETPLTFNFKGPASVEISREEAFERYNNVGFRKRGTSVSFVTQKWKWFGASASFRKGIDINYYPAAGLSPFAAASQDGNATLTFRPGARVRIDESYVYSRLASGTAIFDNHIARSKVNYQLTRAFSLRAILDYNAVLPNERLVDLERVKRINVDLLATYMLHPGTALYVGYGDRYENLVLPSLARVSVPGYSTGRQVFVKLSYMLRL